MTASAERPVVHDQGFVKFLHRPRLTLPALSNCQSCRRINPKAEVMKGFQDFNPQTFASGFLPIKKELCAVCAPPRAAGDNYLKCHRYHVHSPPLLSNLWDS